MKRRRSIMQVLAAVVIAPLLSVGVASPAQADPIPPTNWIPVSLSDLPAAKTVVTDPNNGVTVGCPSGNTPTTMLKSFSSTGSTVQNVPTGSNPTGMFCTGSSAVGKDGAAYVGVGAANGTAQYIQAWKNNSLVWQYTIPCGPYGSPTSMVMGVNGNLYMAVTGGGGTCSGTQLIGLTPTVQSGTNPPVPQVVVNQPVSGGLQYYRGMAAYDDGLVLYTPGSMRYVSYTGAATASVTLPANAFSPHVGQADSWFEASTSGRVFVVKRASSTYATGCSNPNNVAESVTAIDPSGTSWTTSLLTACTYVREVRPTPSGGLALHYLHESSTNGQQGEGVAVYGNDGGILWDKQIIGAAAPGNAVTAVDLNGDVAIRSNVAAWKMINGSTYQFPEISFTLLSGVTGETMHQFALRGESDTISGPSYKWGSAAELAIAKNTVYITAHQCGTLNSCDRSTTKLYAFTVPGLEMDYPRGAILKHDEPWLNYVAMGDSFSSGEGVEPFISGTDTSGPNRNVCHRSEGSYAELLNDKPGTRLSLTNFVACSGAKTGHINGTWDPSGNKNLNELAQDSVLDSNTDIVTVSIGGNDVRFGDFVMLCLFMDCSDSTMNQSFFTAVSNLSGTLGSTYDDILTKAPNATVYVVGYPQIMPDPSTCLNPLGAGIAAFNALVAAAKQGGASSAAAASVTAVGNWLGVSDSLISALIDAGQVTLTSTEMTTGRNLTTALNDKISSTVSAKASARLKFVSATAGNSPFFGHELCTSTSYFNGLDIVNQSYSFHPNQLGQEAYRQVLLGAL